MYYGESVIEEVRSRNDIVDIISGYVKLKRSGSGYMGLCPFHNEKSPSFSVSPSKQIYHCFGCGEGGNVFSFLMKYENYSFGEALSALAERAGVKLPERELSAEQKEAQSRRSKILEINKEAAKYYYAYLRSEAGSRGMDYLKNRGLGADTMQVFGLGYAGISTGLYKYLRKKGYQDDLLRDSGLIVFDEKRGCYDKFFNRVMFPIMDTNNRVIGFGGRVLGDGKPKYLNSPETVIFNKSRNLYGLNRAKLSKEKAYIICEGYMDVISMHQAGFTQAVASLGTAFTEGHAMLLKRYVNDVILIYDSDEAGVRAALRAIPICRQAGLFPRVAVLKPYKDPDEFIKNLGREEFEKRLKEAIDFFYFELMALEKEFDISNPQGRTRFLNEAAQRLSTFTDEIERDTYIKAVASKYSVDVKLMREQVIKATAKREGIALYERPRSPQNTKREAESAMVKNQKLLLTYLVEEKGLYEQVKKYIAPTDFEEGILRQVAEGLYSQFEKGELNPAAIVSLFSDEEEHRQVADIFNTKLESMEDKDKKEKAITDLCIRIKKNSMKNGNELFDQKDPLKALIEKRHHVDGLSDIKISLV